MKARNTMDPTHDRVEPFSNGTEYMSWLERHCFRGCVNEGQCHIQDQLEDGAMTDGTISAACAGIALPTCAAYKLDPEWTPPR